jgi:hypothetical protein
MTNVVIHEVPFSFDGPSLLHVVRNREIVGMLWRLQTMIRVTSRCRSGPAGLRASITAASANLLTPDI